LAHDLRRQAFGEFEGFALKKEAAMTNGILASEMSLSSSRWSSSKSIRKRGISPADAAKIVRHDKPTGSGAGERIVDQALLGGLLDPKSSSLSLTALAQAAASSGKRLILEIRDENPVRIIRTSTRGR
jgi:hypothetical protein